jgi:flagellin-like hook-associated protein FlgL
MCSPVAAGAALFIGGTGFQAKSAYDETKANNKALEYNAGILETNAKTKELQAINAAKIGGIQKSLLKSQVNITTGQQRAAFGASGVVVDEGSAFDVIQETEILGAQDALTMQYNIDQEVFGLEQEAKDLKAQAKGLRMRKGDPEKAALGSILGTAGQVGGMLMTGGMK